MQGKDDDDDDDDAINLALNFNPSQIKRES